MVRHALADAAHLDLVYVRALCLVQGPESQRGGQTLSAREHIVLVRTGVEGTGGHFDLDRMPLPVAGHGTADMEEVILGPRPKKVHVDFAFTGYTQGSEADLIDGVRSDS